MYHGYRLHQLEGNQIYGVRKSGYLLKKSEGKMRVKAWRKRRCEISDGFLFIYHSDESQPPTKLNLLTCQVKLVPGKEKKCFDLISFNRTYHFQVEDEHDITAWVYVIINSKEGALKKQFDASTTDQQHQSLSLNSKDFVDSYNGNQHDQSSSLINNDPNNQNGNHHHHQNQTFNSECHLQQQIIRQVQDLPGNDRCVDCSTTKDRPTWLSTNLGVLVCIECSGIHRDLGVHISRIQSLTLDNINTSQLLIAHNMGNELFNEVFESKLRQLESLAADIAPPNFDTPKLKPNSSMEQRCEFIKAKYLQKKFCYKVHRDDLERARSLKQAVIQKDLKQLLQLYGEGFDLSYCISNLDGSSPPLLQAPPTPQPHKSIKDNLVEISNGSLVATTMPQTTKDLMDTSFASGKLSQHNNLDESLDATNYQAQQPIIVDQDTSIHLALSCQRTMQFECDLYILDFIIQNSRAIDKQNALGETPLHYCAKYNLPECMKLLLKSGAKTGIKNNLGETPLDIVNRVKPQEPQNNSTNNIETPPTTINSNNNNNNNNNNNSQQSQATSINNRETTATNIG